MATESTVPSWELTCPVALRGWSAGVSDPLQAPYGFLSETAINPSHRLPLKITFQSIDEWECLFKCFGNIFSINLDWKPITANKATEDTI